MTLSTLVNKIDSKIALKNFIKFVIITVLVAVFSIIYEHFSFGVYSYYMVMAFAFPLVGGVLGWLIIMLVKNTEIKKMNFVYAYNMAIYTFTIGFLVNGVIEIYGTTNKLINIYWVAGMAMLAFAVFFATKKK